MDAENKTIGAIARLYFFKKQLDDWTCTTRADDDDHGPIVNE